MASSRTTAATAGVLYLVTHVTSIAALVLYQPVLTDSHYLSGPGADTAVRLGAFLEGILALAVVGTSVTLFPVVRKVNEGVALGYVGLRVLEAALITAGITTLLAVTTLRQDRTGSTEVGQALVWVHNWTFLLGPSFVLGVSTVLMAYLMYRSGLVPRFIAVLGLVGGPLEFASATATLFGLYPQVSTSGTLASVVVFAWELSFAFWLILKGFSPSRGAPSPSTAAP